MGSVCNEVIAPYMIPVGGSQSYTGTVVQLEPPAFRLPPGNLKPFLSPDPLHSFVIDFPTLSSEQLCYPPVPIPAVVGGKLDHALPYSTIVM